MDASSCLFNIYEIGHLNNQSLNTQTFYSCCVFKERRSWTNAQRFTEMASLITALPDDVSLQILARVPRQYYAQSMAMVSSSWNSALKSPNLFAVRKRLAVTENWLYTAVVCEHENGPRLLWFAKNKNASATPWWPLPLMPEEHGPVCGFRCAVIGELLYVLGGCQFQNPNSGFLPATNKVSVFNSRTNSWSSVEGMRDARLNFACVVVDGNLFVAGGERSVDVSDKSSGDEELEEINRNCLMSAEMYDPLADRWNRMCDMVHAKHFVSGCVVEGKFGVRGFVCREALQFCEITEIFEAAENRWVEFVEEEENSIKMKRKDGCDRMISWVNSCNVNEEEEMKGFENGAIPQACVEIAI